MRRPCTRRAVGFTLTELLIVIGIIAIVSVVTITAYATIARDSRISTGINGVTASLDLGRALAIRRNRPTLVVFRPRLEGRVQSIEVVFAAWSGETFVFNRPANTTRVVDRFVPMTDVAPRTLPRGIKVAAPQYFSLQTNSLDDLVWDTQVDLIAAAASPTGQGQNYGAMVGVMFDERGRVITRNAVNDANAVFVDFNNDGLQRHRGADFGYTTDPGGGDQPPGTDYPELFDQRREDDESFVTNAAFIAIYDDDRARELKLQNWNTDAGYTELLGTTAAPGWIARRGTIIQFNRYTGVAMR